MHRCRSSPCLNAGACVDLPDNFRCECRRGFTGLLCEADVDECETAQCVNGGLCVNEVISPLTIRLLDISSHSFGKVGDLILCRV